MIRLWQVVFVLCIMMLSIPVMAQTPIAYDTTTLGILSQDTPIAIYSFQGTADDQIMIQAIALNDELDLRVTLQRSVETLAVSQPDPFSIGSRDARIDARLPSDGTYVILVGSPDENSGDFALKLSGQTRPDTPVLSGSPVAIPVIASETSYYTVTGNSDSVTQLNLVSNEPDFQFTATAYDADGEIIYYSRGTSAIILVSDDGEYDVVLRAVDPTSAGVVLATLGTNAPPTPIEPVTATPITTPADTDTGFPSVTPLPYATPILDEDDICGVYSGGFPNIRIAPTVSDNIITQIQPNLVYPVVGVYTNWYQVLVPIFGSGWVRNDVVGLGGDCAGISAVSPNNTPILPTNTPTITPTPTPTRVVSATPTITNTPTNTPTRTNTPLPTDTITPTPTLRSDDVAPPDSDFNNPLNVPLGNTRVSVTNFVSFPAGDTEDRVQWDVTGMDSDENEVVRLRISVTCFGNGTNNVEFMVGNQRYGCGDTLVDRDVMFNSKTGTITITAIGGTSTYVQWVLTGTATRQ